MTCPRLGRSLDATCDVCALWGVLSIGVSGDLSKFGRGDASSPAPATTLAQTQQNQTQTHHTTQQPFLNPALPPGYSYTSLPYYTGMPGLPNTFQYGPAVFPVRIPDPIKRLISVLLHLTVQKENHLIWTVFDGLLCSGGSYLVQTTRCECWCQCIGHALPAG